MEHLLRLGVAALFASLLGANGAAASKCHAVLPSMVPRNMLRGEATAERIRTRAFCNSYSSAGEWKAVLTDVEPLLKAKVTSFDSLVWTSVRSFAV